MLDQPTRRTVAAGGLLLLGAGPALAKPGHIRPDLYLWEGADPTMEYPAASLTSVARMAPANEPGQPMTLTGRVTSWDRNEPVANVVVTAYQTNVGGIYDRVADPQGVRRIRLRAWTRTGPDGRYTMHTIKPGIYPSREQPAHIHMTVFEPGRRPYWIDDAIFDREPLVTRAYVQKQGMRGGTGVVRLARDSKGVLIAQRNIRLERHPA